MLTAGSSGKIYGGLTKSAQSRQANVGIQGWMLLCAAQLLLCSVEALASAALHDRYLRLRLLQSV